MNSALDRWGGVSPTSSAGGGGGAGAGIPPSDDNKNAKKNKKENVKKKESIDDTKTKNKKDNKKKKKKKEWAKDSKKKKKQEQQQNQRSKSKSKNKNKNKNMNTSFSNSSKDSSKDKDKAAVMNVSTTGTDGGSNSNNNNRNGNSNGNMNSNGNNNNNNTRNVNSNHSSRSSTISQTLLRIDTEAPPPIRNILHDDDYEMNDVSTIAGDTFYNGDIMDANIAEAVPPYSMMPLLSSNNNDNNNNNNNNCRHTHTHTHTQAPSGPKGEGTIYPIDRDGNIVTNGSSGDALQLFIATPPKKNDKHTKNTNTNINTINDLGCDSGSTKPITPEKDEEDDEFNDDFNDDDFNDDDDDEDDEDWVPEDYDSDEDDEDDEYDYIYDDDDDDEEEQEQDVFDDVEEYYNNNEDNADDNADADKEEENIDNVAVKQTMKKRRRRKKKKKRSNININNNNNSIDSNERVLPLGIADDDSEDDKKKMELKKIKPSSRRRFKCIMCMGCSLALFLFFGIALLGYTLYAIRNENDDALSLFDKQFWIDSHNESHPILHKTFWKQAGQKLLFWKEFDNDNDEIVEIDDDSSNVTSTTIDNEPITSRLPQDDNISLLKEVNDEILRKKIRSIILTATQFHSVSKNNYPGGNYKSSLVLEDPTSYQYSIIEWLINDPNINNYSNSKIIQRYALGCFYQNLAATNNDDGNNGIANEDVRSTWMSYGDECVTWASTDTKQDSSNNNRSRNGMCTSSPTLTPIDNNIGIGIDTTNGENVDGGIDLVDGKITRQVDILGDTTNEEGEGGGGKIVSIHLENVGFNGTLVPELVLLSDSLESIYLTKNNIRGKIPWTVFSQMKNLKRLQLSRNNFDGTAFPSQEGEGLPTKLEILGLGQNNLSGKIPSSLVLPTSLIYLNIPHNTLSGSIPAEIWNNNTLLEHISFESNNLVGPIPSQLIMNNLDSLKTVLLNGNDLTGNIPQEVCVDEGGAIEIAVDCDLVYCSCCATSNCSTIFSTNATTEEELTFFEVGSGDGAVGTNITVNNFTNTVDVSASNATTVTNAMPVSTAASSPSVTPTSAAPTIDPYLYPYIDNATMAAMIKEFNSSTAAATTNDFSSLNTSSSYAAAAAAAAAATTTTTNTTTTTATANSSSSTCHVIDVGFTCYDTGYSIDFETSNMCSDDVDPLQEYDIIALFPYVVDDENNNDDDADDDWDDDDDYSSTLSPSELQAAVAAAAAATTAITNSSVGTMKSLNESLYWATSCGLSEGCDGVISSPGKIYYRNMYPTRMISPNDSKLIWPIPAYNGGDDGGGGDGGSSSSTSTLYQLTLVRVNSVGDAIILAESRPFIVTDRCL